MGVKMDDRLLMRLDTTFPNPSVYLQLFISYMKKSSSHIFGLWTKKDISCNIASEIYSVKNTGKFYFYD
jgi:hypothetical protein